ncbi:hypothetical protein FOZ60_006104 [Perkinsus olseni]|uniref:RING-type domain-containing protein n=1 Tax=Perkinsus olseni TaxID=32597 RepID=A0A7J6NPI2_PEROL|nr:hypothetical protein FOZ60_006104 [Perkinsus olseni]
MGSKFSCGPLCGKFRRKKSTNSVPVVDQPVGGDTAACNVCYQLNPVGYNANVFVCGTCRSVNRIHRYSNARYQIRLLRHSSTVFAPADNNTTRPYPHPGGSDDNTIPPCAVCLDNPGDIVSLPCCHGGLCEPCALHIASNEAVGGACCPKCRANIDKLVRLAKLGDPISTGVELPIPASSKNRPVPKVPAPPGSKKKGRLRVYGRLEALLLRLYREFRRGPTPQRFSKFLKVTMDSTDAVICEEVFDLLQKTYETVCGKSTSSLVAPFEVLRLISDDEWHAVVQSIQEEIGRGFVASIASPHNGQLPLSRRLGTLRELLCLVQCHRLIDGKTKKAGELAPKDSVLSLHLPREATSAVSFAKSPEVGSLNSRGELSLASSDLCATLFSEYAVRIDDMLRRFAISVDAMSQSRKFRALPREERLRVLSACSRVSFRWASIDRVHPYEGVGYTQATLREVASKKADKPEMPMVVKKASVGKVPNRGGSLDCYSKAAFDKSIRQANLDLIRKYEKGGARKGKGKGKGHGKGSKGKGKGKGGDSRSNGSGKGYYQPGDVVLTPNARALYGNGYNDNGGKGGWGKGKGKGYGKGGKGRGYY